MKLTNRQVLNLNNPLAQLKGQKAHGKLTFKLARLIWFITPILQQYEEARLSLIKKYGVLVEGTEDQYEVGLASKEDKEAFVKEINEVLDTEVEIGLSFTEKEVEGIPEITPEQVYALAPLIVDFFPEVDKPLLQPKGKIKKAS